MTGRGLSSGLLFLLLHRLVPSSGRKLTQCVNKPEIFIEPEWEGVIWVVSVAHVAMLAVFVAAMSYPVVKVLHSYWRHHGKHRR